MPPQNLANQTFFKEGSFYGLMWFYMKRKILKQIIRSLFIYEFRLGAAYN